MGNWNEDPFDVFPIMHALHRLGDLMEEDSEQLYSQYEDVALKYRHIGLEQGLEANSIRAGSSTIRRASAS